MGMVLLSSRRFFYDLPVAAFLGADVAKLAGFLELLHDTLHMASRYVQRIRELAGRRGRIRVQQLENALVEGRAVLRVFGKLREEFQALL